MKKTIDAHGRTCNACGHYKKWAEYHTDKYSKTGHKACCSRCDSGKVKVTVLKRIKKEIPLDGFCQKKQDFCLGQKKRPLIKWPNITTG